MANYNMSATKKIVAELGLTAQLIPANNPNTCAKIIIGTQEFRVANATKARIREILESVKSGCKNVADELRAETNTGNIEELVDLGQSINKALQEYMHVIFNGEYNKVSKWHDQLINFYCYDDEGHEVDGLDKVSDAMNMLLDTKQVVIYNNYIFTREGVKELVKKWARFNNKEINTELVIDKFMNCLG